jgi:hypothetical protein
MIRLVPTDDRPVNIRQEPKAQKKKRKKKRDYDKYLQSDSWYQRARSEKSINSRCSLCNRSSRPLNVHHRTYERVGNERPGDLTVLCDECHGLFHKHFVYQSHSNCFVKR